MSYILEALRRSQAERERGRVPGIDAQPAPAEPPAGASRALPMVWVASAMGVLLLLAAAVAAAWWTRQQPRAAVGVNDGPVRSQPAPAPTGLPPTILPQAVLPPAVLPPAVLPQVVSAPPPAVLPAPRAEAPAAKASTPLPSAAPGAPAAPRPLAIAELSADQRRDLPAMVIGGSIWSDNVGNRFVIVNGQVVREGEAAAAGVTLERVGPKSATLRWRELRIEVPL